MMTTGWPWDSTRTAPTIHCAVTQGPFPAGGTKAHPATAYGAATVAIGIPDTSTIGLGTVGIACPPCAHNTVAPMCKMGPGISSLSAPQLLQCGSYRLSLHCQIIVRAPRLISTVGP